MVRRVLELYRLVEQLFGPEKVTELREDIMAGRTAPINKMLEAAKSVRDKMIRSGLRKR